MESVAFQQRAEGHRESALYSLGNSLLRCNTNKRPEVSKGNQPIYQLKVRTVVAGKAHKVSCSLIVSAFTKNQYGACSLATFKLPVVQIAMARQTKWLATSVVIQPVLSWGALVRWQP